jgi:4-alpha-glucanotransferase
MVSRPACSVHQQIRLRRRIHFNAAVPPDPFRRMSQAWVKRTFNPREDKTALRLERRGFPRRDSRR